MSTSPQPNDPTESTADSDSQATEAGSSFDNAETAVGGADSVPDDPDVNTREPGASGPGMGVGPGAGLSAPENNS
ncbi:MAG TPA: hypothetical protein VE617_07365 [Propionibacteriaceae bacterium]|jgi:hypothetical protein|nr:hypothetical protein [Propionibacteriaceae bacterium]